MINRCASEEFLKTIKDRPPFSIIEEEIVPNTNTNTNKTKNNSKSNKNNKTKEVNINKVVSTYIKPNSDISSFFLKHIYKFDMIYNPKNTIKFIISCGNEWCIFNCNEIIKKYKEVNNQNS